MIYKDFRFIQQNLTNFSTFTTMGCPRQKTIMKLPNRLALFLILFLVVGCNSLKLDSPNINTTPSIDSNSDVENNTNTLGQEKPDIKVGSFVSGEHPTQGTVRLMSEKGKTFIELGSDFTTSELGPDLVLILHRSPDVISSTNPPAYPLKEGDYVVVAPLRQFSGTQQYLIPDGINLTEYKSVGIWCRKFNATFGAAVLH